MSNSISLSFTIFTLEVSTSENTLCSLLLIPPAPIETDAAAMAPRSSPCS